MGNTESSQSESSSGETPSPTGCIVLADGGAKCNLDIVLVHGLRGHRIDTWTVKDQCWPRDFLKNDIKNARIISWGYDANIVNFFSNASQASLFGHGQTLLDQVAQRRTDSVSSRFLVTKHQVLTPTSK